MSFLTKVLLPVLAVLIAMPIITVSQVNQHFNDRSDVAAKDKLTTAQSFLARWVDDKPRSHELQLRVAHSLERLEQPSGAEGPDGLVQNLLKSLGPGVKAIVCTPMNGDESFSARSDSTLDLDAMEQALAPNVELALGGHAESTVYSDGNSIYNITFMPLRSPKSGTILASLSIATELGEHRLRELKDLTKTEVITIVDGKPLSSTLSESLTQKAIEENTAEAGHLFPVLLGNEHFHALSDTIQLSDGNELQYILLSSYEDERQSLYKTRLLLIAISFGGIVFGTFLIYIFIHRLTSPLRLLKEGADEVGRGNFGHKVNCSSSDEYGDLARAFNHMTENLQTSHRELEETVHQLKSTQSQLIESEEGLRLIIEGARDHAIFTLNDEGKILRWNAASERILGYTSREASKIGYAALFPPEDEAILNLSETMMAEANAKGQVSFQGWRRQKDDKLIWADVTLSKLETGGFVEITRDITDRKEAENAMRAARDAAEASDRAKSEFLANMSHEFRTPMNGIIGMASLLSSLDLTAEQSEYTDTIRVSADNLLSIIDDILDISKIEAGEFEISENPTDLVETIESGISPFQADCESKSIGLHLTISNEVPAQVLTDASRLRQIIANLVGNAVKFTNRGGVTVSVAYETENAKLQIAVRDTGIGIAKDHLQELFKPFFQAESSASRQYGGTGLGLTITRNLVDLLEGKISVQSQLGKGSTFTVEIPVASMESEPAFAQFDREKILIVIDDAIAQDALETQLAHWGIEARSVSSRPDPLRSTLENEKSDLLIIHESASRSDTIRTLFDVRNLQGDLFPPIIRLVSSKTKEDIASNDKSVAISQPVSLRALNFHLQAFKNQPDHPFRDSLLPSDDSDTRESSPARSRVSVEKTDSPQEQKPEATPAAEQGETIAFAEQYPMRILVVEDNPINTKVLVRMLKKFGYSPETAENGAEGVRAAEAEAFDTILMDLQMPVLDGLTAASKIINSHSIKHPIYVSAFTANARDEDKAACKDVGMHDFVAKPARIPVLKEMLIRAHSWVSAQKTLSE
ncbi:hybrid sensor histidine kinase/response regulator [Pelagicoccus albus]|uniref:histidine kinase n=1 Tax=Pelagicoccus albus TaxID=415222 RepID=A0A7X1E8D9_9BACT|nr:ATP-binding protein [Pelagicoccus albus]MBC2606171.1 response regulator [Pelagicoccus albus]